VLDIRIRGAGRDQEPDAAWRPNPRPQAPLPNALLPLLPSQPNGDPYPSLVMEVGNSQSIPDLINIRDRMLSWRTAINVFVLISYNRNATRATDTWFLQISVRDSMPRNLRRGLQKIIRPARFCMKPRNLQLDILESNYLSPKALRFTTSRPAISTSPRLYPSSTLFSQHHSELILSKFGSQFSMSAAHKKPGMESTSFVILYTAFSPHHFILNLVSSVNRLSGYRIFGVTFCIRFS